MIHTFGLNENPVNYLLIDISRKEVRFIEQVNYIARYLFHLKS